MTAWSSWFPDLLPQLPGCPGITVEHEVRRSAQRFFSGSRAWNVILPAIPVEAAEDAVAIAPKDTEQDLVRVLHVSYDGNVLEATTGDVLFSRFGGGWQNHIGSPIAYIQDSPGVLRLYPIPEANSASGLVARVAVAPSDASAGIPDNLAIAYRDELAIGAKARLMLYANKPWSAPDLGLKNESDFNAAISRANSSAATSSGKSRIASHPRWC